MAAATTRSLPRRPFGIDVGRLALAVGLSVVIYLFALNETNPETTEVLPFTIPVRVVNVPATLVVVNEPPPVQLRVRAAQGTYRLLRPEAFVAQVDATGASSGENELRVNVTTQDPGVRDVMPEPARVTVRLEAVEARLIPVRVNLRGQVPSGYVLGDIRTDPARVTVAGPASVVRLAQEAVVEVDVTRATVTVNGAFTPRVVDARGNELRENITLRQQSVNVTIPITQQTQFKEVGVRPRITGQPAAGYFLEQVSVEPPTVTLVGEAPALEGASFVETEPIDVAGLRSTTSRRVGLVPSPNTLLLQQGQTVQVTIRVAPLNITQTISVLPTVVNTAPNVVLARPPDPVSVTITGPAPTLASLTARDLRVTLDVTGRGAGAFLIDAKVQNLPEGMQLDAVSPAQGSVELREAPQPPLYVPSPTPSR